MRKLIQVAVQGNVSDIHLLPQEEVYIIFFRISGKLQTYSEVELDFGRRLISYFKYQANMDVGEKRHPQSGSTSLALDQFVVELRLSTISNIHQEESLVIRLLVQSSPSYFNLGTLFPKQLQVLEKLIQRKSGLILFSGPVGSGKTSTIYQLLRHRMAKEAIQVITMEDPVEIYEPRFLQTEVNNRAGIGYDDLIKAALRHHPDILMIGEIRDEETARMVIRGALTGHLMIATIHAKNCLGVLGRLEELQVSQQQLQETLIGVISQRLVPIIKPPKSGRETQVTTPVNYPQRMVLYEILSGTNLHSVMMGETDLPKDFQPINQLLRRAWAYGYISQKTYLSFELV